MKQQQSRRDTIIEGILRIARAKLERMGDEELDYAMINEWQGEYELNTIPEEATVDLEPTLDIEDFGEN